MVVVVVVLVVDVLVVGVLVVVLVVEVVVELAAVVGAIVAGCGAIVVTAAGVGWGSVVSRPSDCTAELHAGRATAAIVRSNIARRSTTGNDGSGVITAHHGTSRACLRSGHGR